MEKYEIKKHWWFWVVPILVSLLFCWTIIIPIIILGYTFLRWKLDKIYIQNNCFNSRLGIIFIDKKTIPLERISFITEKTDIIAEALGFGTIEIQSSAFAKVISYPCIDNPSNIINFINEAKNKTKND